MKRLSYIPGIAATTLISALIALWLALETRYITFWPTDSATLYVPVASRLFNLRYLSDLYSVPDPRHIGQIVLHGKEALILGIAIFQKLLHDPTSLYPNILLLICANAVSAVLVYVIMNAAFGRISGWAGFLIFSFCYWPYMYILQGAHQPLVLMFFLLTVFLLIKSNRYPGCVFFAGLSAGFMLFSSPTSFFYIPYFILLALMTLQEHRFLQKRVLFIKTTAFIAGGFCVILLFTAPDPVGKMQQFFTFLHHSQFDNHFVRFHHQIGDMLPFPYSLANYSPLTFRGGGWLWIWRYCLHFLPVIFLLYIISHYVILRTSRNIWRDAALLFLCLTTPLIVESARLAQFARNYFSWLPGMLFVIGWGLQQLSADNKDQRIKIPPKILSGILVAALAAHAAFNIFCFFTDILPTRMANTRLIFWLRDHHIKHIGAPLYHFSSNNTIDQLDSTTLGHVVDVSWSPFLSFSRENYFVLPPATGKSVWHNCTFEDWTDDRDINRLEETPEEMDRVTAAAFPTMSASRFWLQEEEVCAYRDLILGHIGEKDRKKGVMRVLDLNKLQSP